jgi:hypothetical protein
VSVALLVCAYCAAADVDELVTKFLEAEDKNFSLFNYVNELNNEIEQVGGECGDWLAVRG